MIVGVQALEAMKEWYNHTMAQAGKSALAGGGGRGRGKEWGYLMVFSFQPTPC